MSTIADQFRFDGVALVTSVICLGTAFALLAYYLLSVTGTSEVLDWVLRLEFKTFVNAFVRLPCQIIRTGRKLVYRLLGWNPYQPIFFRLVDVLRC